MSEDKKTRGPKKDFFKIKNVVSEAVLYAYDIPKQDSRILGWIIRWSYGMKSSDWVEASYETIAEALQIDITRVKRSVRNLLKHNAIRRRGSGTKGNPYWYGPQKFVQFWLYPLLVKNRPTYHPKEDDSEEFDLAQKRDSKLPPKPARKRGLKTTPKQATIRGSKLPPNDENKGVKNKGVNSIQIRGQFRSECVGNFDPLKSEARPCGDWAGEGGKDIKDIKRHDPPTPLRGGEVDEKRVPIVSAREASRTQMTIEDAAWHGESAWVRRWANPLTRHRTGNKPSQFAQMTAFLSNGQRPPGFLLACWLEALHQVDQDRANGEKWKIPFAQVIAKARDVFNEKTGPKPQQRETTPKPPPFVHECEPESSQRRTA